MIDWPKVAGELADRVRPETRSKYFPKNPLRRLLLARFMNSLAETLEAVAWESLLDLGAGEGLVDYFLRERFPGRRLTGVEPDPAALLVARRINPGVAYLGADGRALPLASGSFDAVICLEVLEHLGDYPRVIAEAARVSAGPCVFSVPEWPCYQGANFLAGHNWSRLGEHPGHVVSFTASSLRRDLAAVFTTVRVVRSFPWLLARAEGRR